MASYFQQETRQTFKIVNPAKKTHYWLWIDGDQQVQEDLVSDNSGQDIIVNDINVRGVTEADPKKVCMTDDPNAISKAGNFFRHASGACKYFIYIWVTQNAPPNQTEANDYLDSITKPRPASRPDSGVYFTIDHSNFKNDTEALVVIHNAQKGASYNLWIDKEDVKPQKTSGTNETQYQYGVDVRGASANPKKVCMNDVFLAEGSLFPTNYECRWFAYINVVGSDPTVKGDTVDSRNPTTSERPRDELELTMPYSNYIHDAQATFTINHPKTGSMYYVWVDGDKAPQFRQRAASTDPITGTLTNGVGGSSAYPKKVCLNDVEFGFRGNGALFPIHYECRLYVLINVSNETPTDQGPAVSSNDNPQGDTPNDKTSPTPTPVPILPPCIEGVDKDGNPVPLPTYTPDQSNKAAYDAAMSKVVKCTKVDSAIGAISTDPFSFILKLFQIFLSISGGIAMLIIIAAGYRYMTSQGNAEAVKAAQEQITSAVVGLLFLVFSMVILQIIGVDILQLPGFSPDQAPIVTNSGNR